MLQVLVYAGAVMVLFLFIIMLLDLKAEQRRKFNLVAVAGGGAVALGFVVAALAGPAPLPRRARSPFPRWPSRTWMTSRRSARRSLPRTIFRCRWSGVLILVATVGVVVLSRRELK